MPRPGSNTIRHQHRRPQRAQFVRQVRILREQTVDIRMLSAAQLLGQLPKQLGEALVSAPCPIRGVNTAGGFLRFSRQSAGRRSCRLLLARRLFQQSPQSTHRPQVAHAGGGLTQFERAWAGLLIRKLLEMGASKDDLAIGII